MSFILISAGVLSAAKASFDPAVSRPVVPRNDTAWECPSADDKGC